MSYKIFNFLSVDFEQKLSNYWNNISPVSKKSFLWVFLIVNIVFAWHTISFIPDNHSLNLLRENIPINFQWGLGNYRFAGGFIQQFTNGQIFPIFNSLFCFFGFVLSLIYLANYWRIPKTTLCYTLFSLFLILSPYTLPWVYFIRHNTYFWNLFFLIFGLTVLEKPNFIKLFFATFLFTICLGTYISMLSTLLIMLLGRCISEIIYDDVSLLNFIRKNIKTIISIFLSIVIFVSICYFCHFVKKGIPQTNVVFHLTVGRIQKIFMSFFNQNIYEVNSIKIISLIPFWLVLVYVLLKKKYFAIFCIFCTICISLLSYFFSTYNVGATRISFFGTPWLSGMFLALLLRGKIVYKNLALVFLLFFTYIHAVQDMTWQRDYTFEIKAEIRVWDEIISRIKLNQNFNPNKKYNVFIIGKLSMRGILNKTYKIKGDNHYYKGSYSDIHPEWIFNLWEKKTYVRKVFYIKDGTELKDFEKKYTRLNKKIEYPHPDSIFIEGDSIVIVMKN